MSESDDPASCEPDELVVERLPPDEAFELLAHEIRFRILETLNDADDPLPFSDLRGRVGVDDAGKFNYHLRKLTGRFVTEDERGYELSMAGWRVVGAVLAGGYTKALDAEPVETTIPCVMCGDDVELRFPDDTVEMRCRACDETFTNTPVPAGIFEGVAPEQAPRVVDRWLKRLHATADYGFCPNCDGRIERSVRLYAEEDAPEEGAPEEGAPDATEGDASDGTEGEVEPVVQYDCSRCGFSWYSSFPFGVVLHPAIVSVYRERGIDVRTTPYWNLDDVAHDAVTVESREPLRVAVTVTFDEETVVVTFDDDLEIIEQRPG